MSVQWNNFTDDISDLIEIGDSQPLSLSPSEFRAANITCDVEPKALRPARGTGQHGEFRSVEEIDAKYRRVFEYPFFNLVQSRVIDDALYSDKSMVICAPTGSGKTVVFEMAIVHLLMELEDSHENRDFKIIYIAPVKALCTERLTEWYTKFTKLGLLCIEVTGDTNVDFSQLKPYRIIITTPEKWDMLTRRWRDHRQLVEVIKLFLIDEVHILNDSTRGPVLEAVVSRMKTIETSVQSTHRIEKLQQQYQGTESLENCQSKSVSPSIRFVAVSATVGNPEDVAAWLGTTEKPAVYYKYGDELRPVKLRKVVEGYHCTEGTSIFKFDIILNYKLWPIIQKYHNGKPTLIFCNTRKSVLLTAETLSKLITINFNPEQNARLQALASKIKTKKLQTLVLSGVGCHHAGLLYEERTYIEQAFRDRDLPILITTTTLAMGVNLPAHLVIVKNTQQYVNGAYQEYSISTVLQMVGRAGRPQFDTEATAVIMTRMCDKPRYQALVGGSELLQSYLHKRLPENLNSEAALGTVTDVAQCVQWLRSTFLCVRAAKDPKRYLGLPQAAPQYQISKKIEELCVIAMNGLASSGLITMDEACCIESTEAGRLMSIYYLDLETMKHIMKIEGSESLERLLWIVCESHELADMHLRIEERRCLNLLNRNNAASTIRFPMKGKINTRQMKLNCVIQASLGCLPIPDPSLNQETMKIMRIADRVCKCLVAYVTRPALISQQPKFYLTVLNTIILKKCIAANLWENSPFVSKQLKGIGPAFSNSLATAGKVNFMLLEESHPRDLERIMNKGPPAGNILRNQIGLLPKYQLITTPVDEKVVSIKLNLLNHNNLAENMDNLTAGASHKSYVIIGDSENVLLQFTSFTDTDLINVYGGSITYQITRRYGFEHKIFAHCVSSAFAGLDAQCEYVFQNIECQTPYSPMSGNTDKTINRTIKQTTITDTFRERKRKNTDNKIAQSKEKKKRESAVLEKFKNLKESFRKTSKVLKQDLNKSAAMSSKILQELGHTKATDEVSIANTEQRSESINPVKSIFFEDSNTYEINEEDFINNDFLDDEKVNNMIQEIESEMRLRNKLEPSKTILYNINENDIAVQKATNQMYTTAKPSYPRIETYKQIKNIKKRGTKVTTKKSNYDFIDWLEKNIDLRENEETVIENQNTFSDTVKANIDKYLQRTKTNTKTSDTILTDLMHSPEGQINREHDTDIEQSNKQEIGLGPILKTDQNTESPITAKEPGQTDGKVQESLVIDSIDLTTDCEQNDVNSTDFHEMNIEYVKAASVTANKALSKGLKNIIDIKQDDKKNFGNFGSVPWQDVLPPISTLPKQSADDHIIDKRPDFLISIKDFLEFDDKFELPEVDLSKNNKEGTGIAPSSNSASVVQSANMQMLSESLPNDLPGISCLIPKIEKPNPTIEPKKREETTNQPLNLPSTRCLIPEIKDQNLWVEPKTSKIFRNNFMDKPSSTAAHSRYMNTEYRKKQDISATESQEDVNRDEREIIAPHACHHSFYKNKLSAAVCPEICQTKLKDNLELPDIEASKILSTHSFGNNQTITQECDRFINNRLPVGTLSHATETQEKQQFQTMVPLDSNKEIREVLTHNDYLTGGFENKPEYSRTSYEFTDPNNQNPYTNKYSFSSNKIDVSTKETEDHVVRIIRKLRIDMDVIVSQEKKTKSDSKAVSDKNLIDTPRQSYHEPQYLTLPHCNEHNNTISEIYSTEFETEFRKDEPIYKTETFKANAEPIEPIITSNIPREEDKRENNRSDKKNTDTNNKTHNTCHTGHKEKTDSIGRKPTVQSILEKYSIIMSNENSKKVDLLPQTKPFEKSLLKKEKPKRPFKISDINNVIKPLPESIVGKTTGDSIEKDVLSQMEQYKQYNDVPSQILPNFTPKQQGYEVKVNRTENKYKILEIIERVEDIIIPDYDSIVKDLEEKDTDIDTAMFNPKTLLQCYENNSSNIIAPPPEFDADMNETLDATGDLFVPMTCYEPMQWNDDERENSHTEANQSIFDDTQPELTPSREIETWNLTKEQGSDKMYASPGTNPYSFTILRKKRPGHTPSSQNQLLQNVTTTLSRCNKLKQFKFKKDILKLRHQ